MKLIVINHIGSIIEWEYTINSEKFIYHLSAPVCEDFYTWQLFFKDVDPICGFAHIGDISHFNSYLSSSEDEEGMDASIVYSVYFKLEELKSDWSRKVSKRKECATLGL